MKAHDYALSVLDYIKESNVSHVVLSARWSAYFRVEQEVVTRGQAPALLLKDALLRTVEELKSYGLSVWVLAEPPSHHQRVPKLLLAKDVWGWDVSAYQATADSHSEKTELFSLVEGELRAAGAEVIDFSSAFWDAGAARYRICDSGDALYYDDHHLSQAAARLIVPYFEEIFVSTLDRSSF